MKRKNKIIILILTILVILSLFFLYFVFFNHKDTLSISEKQWIDNNKTNVVDISVLNDVPAFTYNGNGVLFDFLNYVSKQTNLSFNPSAFRLTDTDLNNYSFTVKNKAEKNDLVFYKDNYVMINADGSIVNDISKVSNYNIGIVDENSDDFSKYFNDSNIYSKYKSVDELITNASNVDSIILLKTDAMKYMLNKNLNISYEFLSENKYYVLSLNGNNELNSILRKLYNNWYQDNYLKSYNEHLLNDYYDYSGTSTLKQTDIKSKTYIYGFIDNGIYDNYKNSSFNGINYTILKRFSNFANIEIKYKKYDNIDELIDDYENGKVDIMLNNNNFTIKKDSYYTKAAINDSIAIISPYRKNIVLNSLDDLRNYSVSTIKNSKISAILSKSNIKYSSFDSISSLLKNNKNDVIVLDLMNYEYYKTRSLKNYKIDYVINNNSYNYVINNSNINSSFASLFDFYNNYNGVNSLIEENYSSFSYHTVDYFYVMLAIILIVGLMFVLAILNRIRLLFKKLKKKRKSTLTKEEKLKYIDQLTSLKNRAYLNSKVEKWDESDIYPQCVLIIDLNNIAYINDNYGREEGDKIILQAANILIMSQLPNTEIIRTDGNEFLVYLVGYPEKTVIAYQRKLSRAFKNLDHSFGAASGYSMINDAIKTFDDAVNEATIEMRNNKDGN